MLYSCTKFDEAATGERILLGALLLVVAVLFVQSSRATATVRTMLHELETKVSGAQTLSSGSRLPSIRGVDPSGAFTKLDSDQEFLLITITRACLGNQANLNAWRDAAKRLESAGVRTVWVTADSPKETEEYLRERGLEGLVLGDVAYEVYVAIGLGVVPQTAIVRRGTVTAAWKGPVEVDPIIDAFETAR